MDYEKWIGDGAGLPTVTLTQREKALVNDLTRISTNSFVRGMCCRKPESGLRGKFWDKLVLGDSGNPVFLLVGNEPILLFCVTLGGAGAGPAVHKFRFEIQQVMDELCPGYKLESFDFSKVAGVKQ